MTAPNGPAPLLSLRVNYEDHATSTLRDLPRAGQRTGLAGARAWLLAVLEEGLLADLRNAGIAIPVAGEPALLERVIRDVIRPMFEEPCGPAGRAIDMATDLDAGAVTGATSAALQWIARAEKVLSAGKDASSTLDEVASHLMHVADRCGLPYRSAPTVDQVILAQ